MRRSGTGGKHHMARFIFITGGVVSSLGKGLASAALGSLLPVSYTHLRAHET